MASEPSNASVPSDNSRLATRESQLTRDQLDDLAGEFRYVITDMICRAGSGHLGGALSLVEIVIDLYWRELNIDPSNPLWPQRDRVVLSKELSFGLGVTFVSGERFDLYEVAD